MSQGREAMDEQCHGPMLLEMLLSERAGSLVPTQSPSKCTNVYSGVVNLAEQAVYLGVHQSFFNLNIWNLCT